MKKEMRCIAGLFLLIVLMLLPLHPNERAVNIVHADEEEEYEYEEICEDTTWGSEHAVIEKSVYICDGATLTLNGGNHYFKESIEMNSNSTLMFEDGDHVLSNGLSASQGSNVVFGKGNYTIGGNMSLYGGKLTIEKGAHIKFKKGPEYVPSLSVSGGEIIAKGTENERISFEPADESSNNYQITISGYSADSTSEFDYVDFIGGGGTWEGIPEASIRDIFIRTAFAAEGMSGASTLQINSAKVQISNSKFSKSNYYAISFETRIDQFGTYNVSFLKVNDSDFVENANNLAIESNVICAYNANACWSRVTLNNNWYGNADGPRIDGNEEGNIERNGYEVFGWATVNGWSSEPHFPEVDPNAASNVLFFPGLKASRLYRDTNSVCDFHGENTKKVWEPACNEDVRGLYLDSDGKSMDESIHVKDGDILDKTPTGSNIYESFIEKMDEMKNEEKIINDWKPVAYDWRLSLDDILEDESIEQSLRNLAQTSKSKKVTIVAHSNGGLLAKALMQKIGDEETKGLVDKIIFVAVPQVGTPLAIPAMLHGEEQAFLPVLDSKTARGLGENMPGAYNLLPSDGYFSTVQTPVVTFDTDSSSDWKDRYAENVGSKDELSEFLADDFRRVAANSSDVETLAELNEDLLEDAQDLHDGENGLDAWSAPDGVKLIQIAGWGVPATVGSTEYDVENRKYCDESMCYTAPDMLDFDVKSTIDGDGTVVTPSALWLGGDAERYWFDIKKYNTNHKFTTLFGILGLDHANILETPELLSFVEDNVKNTLKNTSEYAYLSIEVPPASDEDRLVYSLHSPLTLDLYAEIDGTRLHTGKNSNGVVEQQIPGTYFRQYGDVKYIYADESIAGHIEMKGYEKGLFTFKVEELRGDESKGTITFKDVPSDENTAVAFDVPSNLESASDLKIDKEGDGKTDYFLKPKIGEVVTLDTIAPEAKIIFNPLTKKLDIIGTDNVSKNVTVSLEEKEIIDQKNQKDKKKSWFQSWFKNRKDKKIITTAILTDEAGNKTEISWGKKMNKDRRIDISLLSISYNGEKTTLLDSGLQYKWMQKPRKNNYVLFASHLESDSTSVESHYMPNKNQTWLMEKPKELADDDSDDNAEKRPVWKKLPGMVIPAIITNSGKIEINY